MRGNGKLDEAMSFCFKQKFKVLQQAERGGSWKSPPRVGLIISDKGKRVRGSKRYEQNSEELKKAIQRLYLDYYEKHCPKSEKVAEEPKEDSRSFYVNRRGERVYFEPKKKRSR